jgi:biopolymer transport protein ExbB
MIPLSFCSIWTLAVIGDRLYWLRSRLVVEPQLTKAIRDLRYGGKTTLIEQLCEAEATPLSRLVKSCLMYASWPKEENAQAVQAQARREIARLEWGLVALEIFTGVGPLMGLMGTIFGLIRIFGSASDAGDLSTQGVKIAAGIAEAMYCTVAGLLVAIPALIAFSFFSRRVEELSIELESHCTELLGKLYSQAESTENSVY